LKLPIRYDSVFSLNLFCLDIIKGMREVFRSRFIAAVSMCILVAFGSIAQNTDKATFKQGLSYLKKKDYRKAEPVYEKLTIEEPENTFYNYALGVCYLNSNIKRIKAVKQLEKSVEKFGSFQNSSPEDAYYYLARAYHLAHRFDDAIVAYKKYREFIIVDLEEEEQKLTDRFQYEGKKLDATEFRAKFITTDEVVVMINDFITDIDKQVKRCNFGKVLFNSPMDVVVENLGSIVNTEYSEYGPVISSNETRLVFTRRSPEATGSKLSKDGDYFEDIFITNSSDGSLFQKGKDSKTKAGYVDLISKIKFNEPVSIGDKVNTTGHEGAIQFSYEGDKLYFYKASNVWISEFKDGEWGEPYILAGLEGVVNTKSHEPSVSISIEEDVVFIASDRKGGFGGLDIYKSVRNRDGSWGEAVNLGETVNTSFDEDGPYVDPDGSTLYFSSKGHSSMGGFDVFKSQFKGEYWTRPPQNMGYPINSASDDIFYMMTPRYNRAYYSSDKSGGYGGMDLYRLTFASERHQLAEVKGLVLEGEMLVPAFSKISILDVEHNEEISTQYSDSVSGDYLLLLKHGKEYSIRVETEGFVPYMKNLTIPSQVYYYQFYQEVHHVHLKDKEGRIIGQKVTMHTALFDIDSLVNPGRKPEWSHSQLTEKTEKIDSIQIQAKKEILLEAMNKLLLQARETAQYQEADTIDIHTADAAENQQADAVTMIAQDTSQLRDTTKLALRDESSLQAQLEAEALKVQEEAEVSKAAEEAVREDSFGEKVAAEETNLQTADASQNQNADTADTLNTASTEDQAIEAEQILEEEAIADEEKQPMESSAAIPNESETIPTDGETETSVLTFDYQELDRVMELMQANDNDQALKVLPALFKQEMDQTDSTPPNSYDLRDIYGGMSTYQLMGRNEKLNIERFTFYANFSKVDTSVLMELKFLKTTAGTKLTELTVKSHNYSEVPMIDSLGREFFKDVMAKDYEKIYSKSAGTLKEKRTFEQFEAYLKIIDKVGEIRSFRFFNHLMNITPDRNYLKIVYKVQINNNRIFFTLRFRNEDGTYKLEDVKM